MSWINSDSYKIVQTNSAVDFVRRNSLKSSGDIHGANFYNDHILIKIYEERDYLHADYYNTQYWTWGRELHSNAIVRAIPSIDDRRALLNNFDSHDDVLRGKSMQHFYYLLHVIEHYMQDFLKGDVENYKTLLEPMSDQQKARVASIVAHRFP